MWVVKGKMKMGGEWTKFTKRVDAKSKERAIELVYSILGSKHRVRRHLIVIEEVEHEGKGSSENKT